MTSDRATNANRRNARASTGPRTTLGKARSKQNARKHGLSARDWTVNAELEIEHLAKLIAGENVDDAIVYNAARVVAEAQVHSQRVKACEIALLRDVIDGQSVKSIAGEFRSIDLREDLLHKIHCFDRYKRRALSSRKFAIRQYSKIVSERRVP